MTAEGETPDAIGSRTDLVVYANTPPGHESTLRRSMTDIPILRIPSLLGWRMSNLGPVFTLASSVHRKFQSASAFQKHEPSLALHTGHLNCIKTRDSNGS